MLHKWLDSITQVQLTVFQDTDNNNTRLTALCPGLPGWAGNRKVKPMWIYWSKRLWVAVASAGPYANLHLTQDNHASTPPLSFLQVRCHSCHQTNSVKALKADTHIRQILAHSECAIIFCNVEIILLTCLVLIFPTSENPAKGISQIFSRDWYKKHIHNLLRHCANGRNN